METSGFIVVAGVHDSRVAFGGSLGDVVGGFEEERFERVSGEFADDGAADTACSDDDHVVDDIFFFVGGGAGGGDGISGLGSWAGGSRGTSRALGAVGLEGSDAVFEVYPVAAVVGSFDSMLWELSIWRGLGGIRRHGDVMYLMLIWVVP